MEETQIRFSKPGEEDERYWKELDMAFRIVQIASCLCQKIQDSLVERRNGQIKSDENSSLLAIAEWSVQAVVSWLLSERLGSKHNLIVTREAAHLPSLHDEADLMDSVTGAVNSLLATAMVYGLTAPAKPLKAQEVAEAIRRCSSKGTPIGSSYWVLNAVDGRPGFLSGDQYAISLALIEDGEVVVGALSCPNYPMKRDWLNYQQRYRAFMERISAPATESWDRGCVMYARKGAGKAWMQALVCNGKKKLESPVTVCELCLSSMDDPALATLCDPVEKARTNHSFAAGLALSVGVRKQPLHVHSMVKYAAIARGDAEIFMKYARAGQEEHIRDHAAGTLILQEAGGVVTDVGGQPLNFSKGMFLNGLDRGIIASSGASLHEKIIKAVDDSWYSSCL